MNNTTNSATLKIGLTVNNPPAQKLTVNSIGTISIIVVLIGGIIIGLIIGKRRPKSSSK